MTDRVGDPRSIRARLEEIQARLDTVKDAYRNDALHLFDRRHLASWDDVAFLLEELATERSAREAAEQRLKALEGVVRQLLVAVNPPDRGGISMHEWNQRLKAASAQSLAVLGDATTPKELQQILTLPMDAEERRRRLIDIENGIGVIVQVKDDWCLVEPYRRAALSGDAGPPEKHDKN